MPARSRTGSACYDSSRSSCAGWVIQPTSRTPAFAKASAGFSPRILTHAEIKRFLTPSISLLRRHGRHCATASCRRSSGYCMVVAFGSARCCICEWLMSISPGRLDGTRGQVWEGSPCSSRLAVGTAPQSYAADLGKRSDDAYFFPSRDGRPWSIKGFITSSDSCYCGVESRMPAAARVRGFMIFGTRWPSIPCCAGIGRAQTSMPSCRYSRLIWAISRWRELSAICTLLPSCFRRSRCAPTPSLAMSFRGGLRHEADRLLRARDQLLDAPPGRAAQSESQYHQSLPRRIHPAASVLPRQPRHRP